MFFNIFRDVNILRNRSNKGKLLSAETDLERKPTTHSMKTKGSKKTVWAHEVSMEAIGKIASICAMQERERTPP